MASTQGRGGRGRLRQALPALLAAEFSQARARVKVLPNGPPVDYPVPFRVVGPDAQQVRRLDVEVKQMLRVHPSMRGVGQAWDDP